MYYSIFQLARIIRLGAAINFLFFDIHCYAGQISKLMSVDFSMGGHFKTNVTGAENVQTTSTSNS
jgi:hypothetical protein